MFSVLVNQGLMTRGNFLQRFACSCQLRRGMLYSFLRRASAAIVTFVLCVHSLGDVSVAEIDIGAYL